MVKIVYNCKGVHMSKLLAALIAGMFAFGSMSVFAAEAKKDEPKSEAKKDEKKDEKKGK